MRYKTMVIFLLSGLMLFGCAPKDEKANGLETAADGQRADERAGQASQSSLKDMWAQFYENMPQDRNMEDDLRNSEFISELKKFLSEETSFDIGKEELYGVTGINDVDVLESSCGGDHEARVIYVGADLYNKAVTDVSVRNKYVFLQMTDGEGHYFKTVSDGDFAFPKDLLFFEAGGKYYAVIISEYCSVYPVGVLLQAYTLEDGEIATAGLFGEYACQGIKSREENGGILFETDYEDGASFGDIPRLLVSSEDEAIILESGSNTLVLRFDGEKYVSEQ